MRNILLKAVDLGSTLSLASRRVVDKQLYPLIA